MSTLEQARAAKPHVRSLLKDIAQVTGVGITRAGEGYAVKVNLAAPPDESVKLPETVDGVPVCIEVVGRITKRAD